MNEPIVDRSTIVAQARHASPMAWRIVETVMIAERLYQLRQRSSLAKLEDLPTVERRQYEQAANTALTVLDTLLAHAGQDGAAS